MFRFLRSRSPEIPLGHLENAVMDILWERGEANVHSVMRQLDRPLAYTTVMTTLDRLYKKGLLVRRKADRAFHYAPRWTRPEWEQKRAGDFVTDFLQGPERAREMLVSCLVEAVGRHDSTLLEELERKVRRKRRELNTKS